MKGPAFFGSCVALQTAENAGFGANTKFFGKP
jgi:hypothetical protein